MRGSSSGRIWRSCSPVARLVPPPRQSSQFPQNATAAHCADGFRPKEKARFKFWASLPEDQRKTYLYLGGRV